MVHLGNFDANDYEPEGGDFKPIPAGWYDCVIAGSSRKETRRGDGWYLELEIHVINGPHSGRVVYDRLNLANPNETAVEIARGTLATICRVVGVLTPSDSSELHGKPLQAKISIRRSEEWGDSNEVKAYRSASTDVAIEAEKNEGGDEIPF